MVTNTEKTKGIRIPIEQAETMRKYLTKNKMLRNDLRTSKNTEFVYFPLKKIPEEINLNRFKIIEKEFKREKSKPKTYKELISIPERLKHKLPTSYDVVGDIIVIKLPRELLEYKEDIGRALLKVNKNIHVVCSVEAVTGELRTRKVEIIAGEKRTETVHIEYGLKFEVDIKKTYFSSRLAAERKRIANLVKNNETVVDMFAGIAPFSIMIAKYAHPKIVYAIDKNQHAIEYARKNIIKNNVPDKVEIIHADARSIHIILNNIQADRIIMNLPFSAYLFFRHALKIAADGCIIHYYDILKNKKIQERLKQLNKIAKEEKMVLTELKTRKIKTYSPREFYISIDIQAKKLPM